MPAPSSAPGLTIAACPPTSSPDAVWARLGEISHQVLLGNEDGTSSASDQGATGSLEPLLVYYQGAFFRDVMLVEFSGVRLKDGAFTAPAGSRAVLRPGGILTFTSSTIRAYLASRFHTANGSLKYAGTPLELRSSLSPDGTVTVTLPVEPGRWVVEWSGTWASPCFSGDGEAWVNVETK